MDRAARVATAIIQIVTDALRNRFAGGSADTLADARPNIEALLRDEFDDVARMVRNESSSRLTRHGRALCRRF